MGQIRTIRHQIVANVAGTPQASQVANLLSGAPGFSVETQIDRFEQVRKVLKGQGQKESRKLAAKAVEVIKERADEAEAAAEQAKIDEANAKPAVEDLIDDVYSALDQVANAVAALEERLDEE